MSNKLEMIFLNQLNKYFRLSHEMFGYHITLEPVDFGTPCFLVVNLDGKTGLIAYTGEPITDKISIAIQTYYNNLIKDWTSDELPSLQVYGAQRTLDDFQNEKPYISAGATKVFNEFKKDISARFPDKEFSFSIDNIWEKVADD